MEQSAQADDSLGAVLSNTFRGFWAVFKKLWPGFLAVYAPLNAIYWMLVTLLDILIGDRLTLVQSVRLAGNIDKLLSGTVGLVCVAATLLAIREWEEGREFSAVAMFKRALSRWGVFFAATLLAGLATFLLFCLCIVPGIIFGVYFVFVAVVAVFGDNTITGAFSDSKSLVVNRWWPTLGVMLVLLLVAVLASAPGTVIMFGGSLPLVIVEVFEEEGEAVAGLARLAAFMVDAIGTVVGGTLTDIATLLFPSGMAILYLRRKANRCSKTDDQPCAQAGTDPAMPL